MLRTGVRRSLSVLALMSKDVSASWSNLDNLGPKQWGKGVGAGVEPG